MDEAPRWSCSRGHVFEHDPELGERAPGVPISCQHDPEGEEPCLDSSSLTPVNDAAEAAAQEALGDPPGEGSRSDVAAATASALDALAERVEIGGGRVLAGFVMVHAEGITPGAGMYFVADDEDGPQSPEDMLSFLLSGVQAFADQHDLPFGVAHTGQG